MTDSARRECAASVMDRKALLRSIDAPSAP